MQHRRHGAQNSVSARTHLGGGHAVGGRAWARMAVPEGYRVHNGAVGGLLGTGIRLARGAKAAHARTGVLAPMLAGTHVLLLSTATTTTTKHSWLGGRCCCTARSARHTGLPTAPAGEPQKPSDALRPHASPRTRPHSPASTSRCGCNRCSVQVCSVCGGDGWALVRLTSCCCRCAGHGCCSWYCSQADRRRRRGRWWRLRRGCTASLCPWRAACHCCPHS